MLAAQLLIAMYGGLEKAAIHCLARTLQQQYQKARPMQVQHAQQHPHLRALKPVGE